MTRTLPAIPALGGVHPEDYDRVVLEAADLHFNAISNLTHAEQSVVLHSLALAVVDLQQQVAELKDGSTR